MKFYQYFIVLIVILCLILTVFNAQANALNITHDRGGICPSRENLQEVGENSSQCVTAKPYNESFTVKCHPNLTVPSNLTLTWLKDSTVVQQNERIKIYTSNKDLVLEFNPIVPDDEGKYECREVKKDENPSGITPEEISAVKIEVLPYVKQAHKDFTVVEENSINLTCTVLSQKPSTVTWTIRTPATSNKEKNFTSSFERIILSKVNSTTNAMLYIKSANLSLDRGFYNCTARNDAGFSVTGASFMIRLKSKYASLWPFLGICAEVIVLCAIILIYEKKRDKSEMEESDTDQGPETKSSPDHGQDGVRYRK